MPDVEAFHHSPLQEGQIRLIGLKGGSSEEPIECQIFVYELSNAPPFDALSYSWGSPEDLRIISVQNSRYQVRESLYNALQDLRQQQEYRFLWVDFMCINQEDHHEKKMQISLMASIYAKANSVVVYLGKATEATDRTMDYLMQLEEGGIFGAANELSRDNLARDILRSEGFYDMLSRPWFSQPWVLQDIADAQVAMMCCGSKAVHLNTFLETIESFENNGKPMSTKVLRLILGSTRRALRYKLYEFLQLIRQSDAGSQLGMLNALNYMVEDDQKIPQDYPISERDLIRQFIAVLCFCELTCVPETPYSTISAFLSDLELINKEILEKIFESSVNIDLQSLLHRGSHYIEISPSLLEAASRNKTKGQEMVQLLHKFNEHRRSGSPVPSEAPSVFSDVSAPTTNTSYPSEDIEISVLHLVDILTTQHLFADLCRRGFNRQDLDPARFANNLRRMLKTFGKTLRGEDQSRSAQLTAQLVLGGARRIAALIRLRCDASYEPMGSRLMDSNLDSMTDIERRSRIEYFIRQVETTNSDGVDQNAEENSDSDDDPDAVSHEESALSSSLDEIEKLIPSSKAFENLMDSLKSFLKLSNFQEASPVVSEDMQSKPMAQDPLKTDQDETLLTEQQQSTESSSAALPIPELPKISFWSSVYEGLSDWLTRIEKPKSGLHRIQCTCSCGELMFMDVKEVKPGGLERFQKQLAASSAGAQGQKAAAPEAGAASSNSPSRPERAYLGNGSGDRMSNLTPVPAQNESSQPPSDPQTGSSLQQNIQTVTNDTVPQYLLLCVNTRSLTQLLHVDLRYVRNDQFLFDSIRRRYWEARRENSWHYGLLTPRWLASRMPSAWADWLETLHLRVPRSAELIEFRLMPFHRNICPDKIKLGLPPEDQVKVAKNYHYDPCPTDVEVLCIPKFSHLLKPGFHSYDFWLKTFPKKLRIPLAAQPAVVGWGLTIHEGWDWVVLLSQTLALLLLVGAAVVLYAVLTHDPATAVGFGAYVVAIMTLWLTIKYWAWQENDG